MGEQHDDGIGFQCRGDVRPLVAKQVLDDPPVLHVGRQQAQRHLAHLGPGDRLPVAERAVGGGKQAVLLPIERHRLHAAQRLVVQIGHARVDLEVLQHAEDLDGVP